MKTFREIVLVLVVLAVQPKFSMTSDNGRELVYRKLEAAFATDGKGLVGILYYLDQARFISNITVTIHIGEFNFQLIKIK